VKRAATGPLGAVDNSAARYISPEQWEGQGADARSDIFAFGTVLYEMLTGTPAFEGKTQAMLIAAIETVDPDPVFARQPMTPPALDYIVKRCLEKEPKQRLQTAWDLLSQLQWIAEGGSQIGVPAQVVTRTKKRNRVVWISLGVAVLLILAMVPATYRYLKGSPEPEDVRFIVANMGNSAVNGGPPASVSTDGRWIVRSPGGTNGLNAVFLSSVTQQFLLKDFIVTQPFWSPDSKSIGFFQDNNLKVGDVASGQAKNICEAAAPIAGGTWNDDGIILFSSVGSIYRVLAAGGQPTAIVEPDKKTEIELLAPFFLPDGRHFLYLSAASDASQSAIYIGLMDSKEKIRLFASDSRAYYAAPGYILFNKENAVFARPFDAGKLQFTGEAVRIVDGVPLVNSGPNVTQGLARSASFAVSQTGVFVHRIGGPAVSSNTAAPNNGGVADRVLTWIDRAGGRIGQVGGPAAFAGIDLSGDSKKVAVHVQENNGGDSWFFDSAQGRMQRLTFDASQNNGTPVWNPDGTKIAFSSTRQGRTGLYVKPADGTAKEELIFESELPKWPMSWTPDGKQLVFEQVDPKTHEDIWVVPITGDKKPVAVVQSDARERSPQVSPDGKWIAYTSHETGRAEVFIKQFPEGPGKWQISTEGGGTPRWRGDSKELFYALAPNILAVDIHVTGGSIQAGAPHVLFGITTPGPNLPIDYSFYAVASDGKRFLVPQAGAGAAINGGGGLAELLATTADQGGQTGVAANSLLVIMNWPHLMKRK
jgi:Tol biopolymer transport system component